MCQRCGGCVQEVWWIDLGGVVEVSRGICGEGMVEVRWRDREGVFEVSS